MTAPHFVRTTTLSGVRFMEAGEHRVIDRYDPLTVYLTGAVDPEATNFFTEPVFSRRTEGAQPKVSWYAAYPGDPVPLTTLSAAAREGPEGTLRRILSHLCNAIEDRTQGAVVAAALYVTALEDVFVIGDRVVVTNWGLIPEQALRSWGALERHFARTLGRFAPFTCPMVDLKTPTRVMPSPVRAANGWDEAWQLTAFGETQAAADGGAEDAGWIETSDLAAGGEDRLMEWPDREHKSAGDLGQIGQTVVAAMAPSGTLDQSLLTEGTVETETVTPRAKVGTNTLVNHTYMLEKFIAKGGMGEVYRARNVALDTIHAIKIILPEFAKNPQIVSMFSAEAYHLRKVHHDAVVGYEGTMLDAVGNLYLVMEFVDGPSLADQLRSGPLPVDGVLTLRNRVASGLAAAHDQHVYHRDVSPDNVILPNGRLRSAKIIDFGIAKGVDRTESTILRDGFGGKLSFASPEQLRVVDAELDERSDIYSLGLVMVAAALGKPLNMGRSFAEAADKRRYLPDLTGVPDALHPILVPMLQPDPEQRVRTMRDVLVLKAAEPPPEIETGPPPPSQTNRGRRGLGLLIVLLLILALAAGAGYLAVTHWDSIWNTEAQ